MRHLCLVLLLLAAGCASSKTVRFATFNTALSKPNAGELLKTMQTPDDPQAKAVAEIVQRVRPDVLLLQEFDHGGDYDPDGRALDLFQINYLGQSQNGGEPIRYGHVYLAPSNTGLPTGVDLNGDGLVAPCAGAEVGTDAYAADCHGWGRFPGQYAFAVLSKYPIDRRNIRTFQNLLWKDLPGNHLPPDYYPDTAKDVLRLSSKNHVDVPILVGEKTIHVLAAHPTPPVFDGPEDRNGRRNYDEVGAWNSYLGNGQSFEAPGGRYFFIGHGGAANTNFWSRVRRGFLSSPFPKPLAASAVVLGDLNADPDNGDAFDPLLEEVGVRYQLGYVGPMRVLLSNDRINDRFVPESEGAAAASRRQGGANARNTHPAADTADWDDSAGGPGNLRVDYVLPSVDLNFVGGGVFWPTPETPLMGTTLATVERASDHRLVWVDVKLK